MTMIYTRPAAIIHDLLAGKEGAREAASLFLREVADEIAVHSTMGDPKLELARRWRSLVHSLHGVLLAWNRLQRRPVDLDEISDLPFSDTLEATFHACALYGEILSKWAGISIDTRSDLHQLTDEKEAVMAPVVKQMTSDTWSKIGDTTWSDGGFIVASTTEWLYVQRGEWKSSSRPPEKDKMSSDDYALIKGGTLNEEQNYIQNGGNQYQVAYDEDPPGGGPPKAVVTEY